MLALAADPVTLTGVEAELREEAEILQVEAPEATWDLAEGTVVFSGGVLANRGTLVLRCEQLSVRLDASGGFQRATCDGPVEASRGSWWATGGRAELEVGRGELVLEDGPRLGNGQHEMVGERILFALDEDRVDCSACRLAVDLSP